MGGRILVIDDEPDLRELVRVNLEAAGYRVETARSVKEGRAALDRERPDLLVLDLMLPDAPGTDLCRQLRADPEYAALPIIMLTARSEEVDRIVGLELGADDYVTKPFSPRELSLRIGAVLRRRDTPSESNAPLSHGPLQLDPERHRCHVDGGEVPLTAKEFELLRTLMSRPGRVLTRDALLASVWGPGIAVTTRTVDTHLKRLREKLGSAGDLIETVRGVGYRFVE
jgi:two-component system phosphate regulon response regulator PhoB